MLLSIYNINDLGVAFRAITVECVWKYPKVRDAMDEKLDNSDSPMDFRGHLRHHHYGISMH